MGTAAGPMWPFPTWKTLLDDPKWFSMPWRPALPPSAAAAAFLPPRRKRCWAAAAITAAAAAPTYPSLALTLRYSCLVIISHSQPWRCIPPSLRTKSIISRLPSSSPLPHIPPLLPHTARGKKKRGGQKKKFTLLSTPSRTPDSLCSLYPSLNKFSPFYFALAPGCRRRCCFAPAPGTVAAADVFTSGFRAFAIAWLGLALAFFCALPALFASPSQEILRGFWGSFHVSRFTSLVSSLVQVASALQGWSRSNQVSPLLTSFLVQVASALQEWDKDDVGVSKKSHINYHWPFHNFCWFVLFYPELFEHSSSHLHGTLAPAQVLSSRISPKPSSVYSRSGTGAHLRVFTKALFFLWRWNHSLLYL